MGTEQKTATELLRRYYGEGRREFSDCRFSALVNMLVAYMMDQKIAPDEMRDAAFVASLKFMQLKPVRQLIYVDDTVHDKIRPPEIR